MKLSNYTKESVTKSLYEINEMIKKNSGNDLEKIKDGLLSVLQEIDEEYHRCYTEPD
jgi:hypothetical protein